MQILTCLPTGEQGSGCSTVASFSTYGGQIQPLRVWTYAWKGTGAFCAARWARGA